MTDEKRFVVAVAFFADRVYQRGQVVAQSAIPKGHKDKFVPEGEEYAFEETPVVGTEKSEPATTEPSTDGDGNDGEGDGDGNDGGNTGVTDKNTVAEIKAFAEENEIDLSEAGNKAEMLEIIANAMEA
jgi:hypothetical protein